MNDRKTTPTPEEVRHDYAMYMDWLADERRAAFDRMIEQITEDAYERGREVGRQDCTYWH